MAVQHQQKCNCSALTIKSTQGTTAQGLLTTKILAIEYIGNGDIAEQKFYTYMSLQKLKHS
jgi:hypothetical protein